MISPLRRRVLLVDDSPFVRRAFRRVLKDVPDVEVVGEASDGLEAMAQVPLLRPDVVLLDLGMPGLDGQSVLERLRANHPGVAVVVVSQAYRNGVDLTLYESGAAALKEGALSGGDMTPSAALVKLMQGLAYHRDREALARFIETPIVGEMTERAAAAQEPPVKKSRRTR